MSTTAQRKALAEYQTDARKNRCDRCAHIAPSRMTFQSARYDRHCLHLDCPVKTNGSCSEHEPNDEAELARDEFPAEHNAFQNHSQEDA